MISKEFHRLFILMFLVVVFLANHGCVDLEAGILFFSERTFNILNSIYYNKFAIEINFQGRIMNGAYEVVNYHA
jgi:hypothetical protein